MRSRSMNSILFYKSKHFKFLFTTLASVFLCTVMLAGCNNFLNGGETKKQIEDSIAYANAQSYKLYLKSDSGMGSFLSEGEVECKVGYTVDIQFTLNKDDWYFDTLEAVSTADAAESRQDYVQFTLNEKKSDKSKGIYVITVKLLKPAGDILIKPKCLPLPYVTGYTPNTKNAQFANTPVVINFNIPIEDAETGADDSLINYDNILLTFDKPGDMKVYFFPPELNEDKTVLKIVPNAARLKNYIADELKASFVDITISLSDRIIVKNGEQEFPLRQDSNSTFTVRFGVESEETPPDERDFFVSGHEITLATASELDDSKKLLLNKLSPDLTIAQCIQNMTPATMFIYGKYYDKDSGVRSIEVSEKYRGQFATNTAYYSNYDIVTTSYDLDSNNVEYISENGYTSFLFKYRIQGTLAETAGGGYFDLSVTIKDACGNPSETKSFAVLCMEYGDTKNFHEYTPKKDTFYQHGINVTNTVFSKAADGSSGNYDFSKYNSDIKTIVIKDDVNDNEDKQSYFEIESRNYNEKKILLKDVKFVCEYIDRFGTKRREPFTDYNSETKQRSVVLDIDSVTGKSFTVIPLYDDIPLGRKTFNYPSIPPLATEIDSNHVRQTDDNSFECIGICQYPDGSSKIIFGADYVYLNKFSNCKVYLARLDPNHTGYDNWPAILEKNKPYSDVDNEANASKDYIYYGLLGELIGPFEYGQESVPNLPIPEIKDYEIVKSEKKGYVDVIIKFAADVWDSYDSMTIINDTQKKDYKFEQKDTFAEGEYVCYKLPPIETKKFFSNPYTGKSQSITVSAMKGYVYVKRTTNVYTYVVLKKAQQTEFDDMEPADLSVKTFKLDKDKYGPFSYNNQLWYQSRQYVVFSFSDYGSGPKSGKMWLNGGSTVYEMTDAGNNSFEGQMPIYLFKWGENEISYRLEDNKGNVTEGTLICNTKNWGKSNAILTECPTYSSSKATLTYPSYLSSDETSDFQVFQFDGMSDSKYPLWVAKEIATNATDHTISVAVESGKFYRVIYRNTDAVYYAGTITDTAGDYNYVNQNGSSEDSVVICSGDSKVLVTVCSVKDTMEECKEWNASQWKMMCRRRIENVFEVTPKVPKVYKVPEEYFSGGNNIVEANSYYCVIAHFANGDCIVGPVMHH